MFTQCPACKTVFAVTAEQLDAAGGRVRCGACRVPFDALLFLVRQLPDAKTLARGPEDRLDAALARLAAELTDAAPEGTLAAVETGGPGPARRTPAPPPAGAETPRAGGRTTGPERAPLEAPPCPGEVPEALARDLALLRPRRSPWYVRLAQSAAVLVLLVLLAFQLAWLRPEAVLAWAPFLQPWLQRAAPALEAASASLGWARPVPRDTGRIRVTERDIREHPHRPGALLFNATLLNEAGFEQPPPRVQLTLFDVNGRVLARRAFGPAEYLDPADAVAALAPGAALQLRLEMVAPSAPAVSYQLELL